MAGLTQTQCTLIRSQLIRSQLNLRNTVAAKRGMGRSRFSTKFASGYCLILSRRIRRSIGAEHLVPEKVYYTKIAIRVTAMNKV